MARRGSAHTISTRPRPAFAGGREPNAVCDDSPVAVLIASNLRKELAGSPLFDGVSFKLEPRERLALSGRNGAGKTTLLRILAGQTRADGGELVLAKGTRVALHDQRPPLERGSTLREYVLTGAAELVATEQELRRLEEAMAGGAHDHATLGAYSRAQTRLEHAGGYAWRERANAVVRGLGFADLDLDRRLETFSGGELTRASLARALAGDPHLLLLDEPTNHLDVESLEWLERELASLDAACVIVAHDRWFLEATATAVLELERGSATFFPGEWHVWRSEKAARAASQARTAERQADELARLERFVGRFRYGTKARQAQSRLKRIERLSRERITAAPRPERALEFRFTEPKRSGRDVLVVDDATIEIGGRTLLEHVSLAIERGEHVALVGPNGSGKTTLLEEIVAGRHRLGYGVETAYFSQHDVELPRRGSVLDAVQGVTGLPRPRAQALLGQFLFSGWEAHEKPVTALSGGERRRLALAILVASGANFLVLDEPTNHLDLESREALEAALEHFPGTVFLVSHDRAMIDAVARRTAAVEAGTLHVYAGGWADLLRLRNERAAAVQPSPDRRPRGKAVDAPAPRAQSRPELDDVEGEIESTEKLIAELEERLAVDWADADTVTAHRRARERLQGLFARWEQLLEG
jgi:ATP-binding cassette subfamily F protein 3